MLGFLGEAADSISVGSSHEFDLTAVCLLSLALMVCLVAMLMVIQVTRSARLAHERALPNQRLFALEQKLHPPVFAVPTRWLAIRSENPEAVQSALGLLRPRPCSWEEGFSAAQERKLFISPSVDGWILVMGSSLPEPAQDVDKCFHFIVALSKKLGVVQFFSANRANRSHAWAQAADGVIQRAYAWAGTTLCNQGRMTKPELDLKLNCLAYAEPPSRIYFSHTDPTAFNTARVPLLAARWSLDPASVRARVPREIRGIAGEVSRSSKG